MVKINHKNKVEFRPEENSLAWVTVHKPYRSFVGMVIPAKVRVHVTQCGVEDAGKLAGMLLQASQLAKKLAVAPTQEELAI